MSFQISSRIQLEEKFLQGEKQKNEQFCSKVIFKFVTT